MRRNPTKIQAVFMCVALTSSLFGCSGGDKPVASPASSSPLPETNIKPVTAPVAASTAPLKDTLPSGIDFKNPNKRDVLSIVVNGKTTVLNTNKLLKLKQQTYNTSTNWTPKSSFVGVKLSDLVAFVHLDLGGVKSLDLVAWDNYRVTIPVADLNAFEPILAYQKNNQYLDLQGLGPYWVIYNRDANPDEINKSTYVSRFIWQVRQIQINTN